MNRLTIIGNLTADPVKRATQTGKVLADFTVAVNGRNDTTFFRCTAWERKADPILTYLHKGDKVAVVGPVSGRAYTANNEPRASLEVLVDECEFLSTRSDTRSEKTDKQSGMTVSQDEDIPF